MSIEKLARKNIFRIRPYSPGKPIEEVQRELGLKEIIKIASNESPFPPALKVRKAIIKNLRKLNRYPEDSGYYLKKALAKKHKLKEGNFILGNGSDEIMEIIAKAFLNPEDEVIFGQPSFVMYKIITQIMDARPVGIPLKNYTYNLKEILKKINKRTKLIFISNPNNPTGTYVCEEEVHLFLKHIPANVLVVFDEAYFDYVQAKNFPHSLAWVKKGYPCIVLRTFSKAYGLAGLRLGYGIAAQEIVSLLNRVRLPFNTNTLAQAAALASLEEKDYLKKMRFINAKEKIFLYKNFRQLGLKYVPSEANFVLVNVKQAGEKIFARLLKKGIIVRSMENFGLPDFIRVTVGRPGENKRFIHTLKSIEA